MLISQQWNVCSIWNSASGMVSTTIDIGGRHTGHRRNHGAGRHFCALAVRSDCSIWLGDKAAQRTLACQKMHPSMTNVV